MRMWVRVRAARAILHTHAHTHARLGTYHRGARLLRLEPHTVEDVAPFVLLDPPVYVCGMCMHMRMFKDVAPFVLLDPPAYMWCVHLHVHVHATCTYIGSRADADGCVVRARACACYMRMLHAHTSAAVRTPMAVGTGDGLAFLRAAPPH